jgi:menaquinone-9 beta-reductase
MRFAHVWREFPKLGNDFGRAEPSSSERGAATVTRRLDKIYRGNIALIGDASGSVDAITGEGLGLSFRQAIALAEAIGKGKLESYQRAHRRLARRPHIMGRLLLLLDRYASLRGRVLRCLAEEPELFARLLGAHLGVAAPDLLATTSLRLGWKFLTV